MTKYSTAQIGLMQKFVDTYRAMPEIFAMSQGFVGMPFSAAEMKDIGSLVEMGIIEARKFGQGEFYRLSKASLPEIKRLNVEGKINYR